MNEAAERLRGGLEAIRDTSTDSASRQLADSLLALLAVHDAAERRATVERIRAQIEAARPFTWRRAHADPPTGHSTDIDLPVVLAILDEEAAR